MQLVKPLYSMGRSSRRIRPLLFFWALSYCCAGTVRHSVLCFRFHRYVLLRDASVISVTALDNVCS